MGRAQPRGCAFGPFCEKRGNRTMRDERIQKVLAAQGVCSRRAAEQLIAQGRVKLNGRPVGLGDKMDTAADVLSVDGQRIYVPRKTEKYYYMLHKPRGFITTTSDERGRKTVMDLMEGVPARVYPVGRLDKDSEGLLLLTLSLIHIWPRPALAMAPGNTNLWKCKPAAARPGRVDARKHCR